MSRKKILQGIIAGIATVSIINAGCIKDVKAETAEVVNTKVVTEDNSVSARCRVYGFIKKRMERDI